MLPRGIAFLMYIYIYIYYCVTNDVFDLYAIPFHVCSQIPAQSIITVYNNAIKLLLHVDINETLQQLQHALS